MSLLNSYDPVRLDLDEDLLFIDISEWHGSQKSLAIAIDDCLPVLSTLKQKSCHGQEVTELLIDKLKSLVEPLEFVRLNWLRFGESSHPYDCAVAEIITTEGVWSRLTCSSFGVTILGEPEIPLMLVPYESLE